MTTSRKKTTTTRASPKSPKLTTDGAAGKDESKDELIAPELEAVLHIAFVGARQRRHGFVTVEHLLLGLLDAPAAKETLLACGADTTDLASKLSVFIDENTPTVDGKAEVDTQPTLGFQRIIQRAIMHVMSSAPDYPEAEGEKRQVGSNDVLVSLFGEKDSHAVYYLRQQGVTRVDVVGYLADGTSKGHSQKSQTSPAEKTDIAGRDFFSLVAEASTPFARSQSKSSDRPKLFISYSHVDTACLDRLLVHLKPLERSNSIICWSDKRIRTGDKWRSELEDNLEEAVIAVLLISADFLASDFIINNELPPLLVKADANGLRILPVILKPCGFRRDPVLSAFQSANDPMTPLLGMSQMDQEALYDKIADEVSREIALRRAGS
jgi:hypothetical protein